jgi:hypothetical protein
VIASSSAQRIQHTDKQSASSPGLPAAGAPAAHYKQDIIRSSMVCGLAANKHTKWKQTSQWAYILSKLTNNPTLVPQCLSLQQLYIKWTCVTIQL